jgi:hypothetical protein
MSTGGVCGGAGHAGAGGECPCQERLRGAKSGRQMGGFATDAGSTGSGGGWRFRTASFGCGEDVQEVAFITLVIITVLPGTANICHPRKEKCEPKVM